MTDDDRASEMMITDPPPPARVLALDTSTVVTVGVARGREVLAVGTVEDRMSHAEQLMPLVDRCLTAARLRPADIDALVVGLGPGPFTGLRVGIVTAQVLSSVLRRPLHGVCSLDVIAADHALHRAAEEGGGRDQAGDFLAVSDARRREVYWARYTAAGVRVGPPQVGAPDTLPELPVVGPGAALCAGHHQPTGSPDRLDPGVLATRGLQLPEAGREPLYLRRPDAVVSTRPKSVLHFHEGRR